MRCLSLAGLLSQAAVGLSLAAALTSSAVNLRSRPAVDQDSFMRRLPAGTALTVLGERMVGDDRWLNVTADTDRGWVRADHVALDASDASAGAPPPEAGQAPTAGITIAAANLRSGPGASGLIRTLPPETDVLITGERNVAGASWLHVTAGGDAGWIRADLVRAQPTSAPIQPAPENPASISSTEPVPTPALAPELTEAPRVEEPAGGEPLVALGAATGQLEARLYARGAESKHIARATTGDIPWPRLLLRDCQVLLAALVLALVLARLALRLERHLPGREASPHSAPGTPIERALANEGIRRECDRFMGALYAIERLLIPNATGKSVGAQLTDLLGAVNTTEGRERLDRIAAVRRRMIDAGFVPAFSRAFDGLSGYGFNDQVRERLHAFLCANGDIESRFADLRESTRLCFDDLNRRLVGDLLHSGTMTLLLGQQPHLLDEARTTARAAATRGWTTRDLEALRQVLVKGLGTDTAR